MLAKLLLPGKVVLLLRAEPVSTLQGEFFRLSRFGHRERLVSADNGGLVLLNRRVEVTGHFPLQVNDDRTVAIQYPPFVRRFCDPHTAAQFVKVNGPQKIALRTDNIPPRVIYEYRAPGTFESITIR